MDLVHLRGLFVALPPTTGRFREEGPRGGEAGLWHLEDFSPRVGWHLRDSCQILLGWLCGGGGGGVGGEKEWEGSPGQSWVLAGSTGIRALTKWGCFLGHPMPQWASV